MGAIVSQTDLLMRSLFGDRPLPPGERASLLWGCRRIRADRAWIKVGCYAWWIHTEILQATQHKLLALRHARHLPSPQMSATVPSP